MNTSRDVVIIGSGGHAKVIIDIFRSSGNYTPIGCTDLFMPRKEILGVPLLGDDSVLPGLYGRGIRHAFVALGDNSSRVRADHRLEGIGFERVNAISPFSYVAQSAALGRGIAIMPGAVINPDTEIGDGVIVNTGATVDHDCIIGAYCHIAPGCNLAGNVRIGEGSLLGVGCSVIPRVAVGKWSVVGAGAVVTGDLPEYTMALGVPARVVRQLEHHTAP